jgi:hypothetical protein
MGLMEIVKFVILKLKNMRKGYIHPTESIKLTILMFVLTILFGIATSILHFFMVRESSFGLMYVCQYLVVVCCHFFQLI